MNAFEEKMWERREGEMIGEKRGKKIGERIGEERGRKEGVAQGEKTKQREILAHQRIDRSAAGPGFRYAGNDCRSGI